MMSFIYKPMFRVRVDFALNIIKTTQDIKSQSMTRKSERTQRRPQDLTKKTHLQSVRVELSYDTESNTFDLFSFETNDRNQKYEISPD